MLKLLKTNTIHRINIRPGVSILSILPHLNYKPWYALAEFVDNALQSYLANKRALQSVEGSRFRLLIDIDFDAAAQRITIRDNAAGIDKTNFARAFKAAAIPPDATGLSEFGMGMKSAAAWFAPKWTVRTKALGESAEKTVRFDIERIVKDTLEELEVRSRKGDPSHHFTEIILDDVRKMPQTKTVTKIRDHLSGIYRRFTRRGDMELRLNGELLTYEEPEILVAPRWKHKAEKSREWRHEVDIELSGGRSARGFVAIRARGSTARAGLALFRRNRLIEGSGEDTYRPPEIFGAANSFAYQRIFGEIDLVGFKVSHTKDGIRWDEAEEEFISKLRASLATSAMPILDQAQNWRSSETSKETRPAAKRALEQMRVAMPEELGERIKETQKKVNVASTRDTPEHMLRSAIEDVSHRFNLSVGGSQWELEVAFDYRDQNCEWVRISDQPSPVGKGMRRLGVKLAMLHPFSQSYFANCTEIQLQGLARLAIGLVLSETIARDGGVRYAGRVRIALNELLRIALAG